MAFRAGSPGFFQVLQLRIVQVVASNSPDAGQKFSPAYLPPTSSPQTGRKLVALDIWCAYFSQRIQTATYGTASQTAFHRLTPHLRSRSTS